MSVNSGMKLQKYGSGKSPLVLSRNGTVKKVRKHWQLYVLVLLPLAYIMIFKYVPMYGAQIAFRDFSRAKIMKENRLNRTQMSL